MSDDPRSMIAGCTVIIVGESSPLVAIENALYARGDVHPVISVGSTDTAIEILENVPVECLVCDLTRPTRRSKRGTYSDDSDTRNGPSSPTGTDSTDRVGKASEPSRGDDVANSTAFLEMFVDVADDIPIVAVTTEQNAELALEAGVADVIGSETPAEVAGARIVNAAARHRLESISSERRGQTSFERTLREASTVHDERQVRHDHLESLVDRIYATGWRIRNARSRRQLEERLCEGVASIEGVDLVWVGRLTPEVVAVTPETWVGELDEYLTAQTYSLESEDLSPTAMTALSGTRTVIEDIRKESSESQWARTALEHGIRSICSVPIDFQGITYGCLTVCSEQSAAFDQRTIDGISTLGQASAVLLNRLDLRAALSADRLIELEILAETGDDPLMTLTKSLDRRVEVDGFSPRATTGSVGTVSVASLSDRNDGISVGSMNGIRSADTVAESDDFTRIQIQFAERTIVDTLSDHGAVVRSLEPVGNRIRIRVTVPMDGSVRRIVQLIEQQLSSAELFTRRSEPSTRDRVGRFEERLEDGLTERQLQTLQTAYFSGYFDWPRKQTGEEIADALGVSQPTFTRHFRTAQRKLFELLFDDP